MKKLFTFLVSVVFATCVWAQSPQKMSYQAIIRNSSGQLVTNHTVGIKISILQGSASGAVVSTETQTPTSNANGLISIEIGGGAGFSTINWSAGPYFIKTETDPTGGTSYTISGTNQLLSVPFALYAANSGSGWSINGNAGTTSTNFIGTSDNKDVVFKRNNTISGRIGTDNTSLGFGSLYSNLSGTNNTANGKNSLYFNTSGIKNTAIGESALYHNTAGGHNTSVGLESLFSNTTGNNNNANGDGALYSNTTGNDNTAVGFEALVFNKTGNSNAANGFRALASNTAGNNNTAMGYSALKNNSLGFSNSATGFSALFSNTTGDYNTATGEYSLFSNTVANNNTANGYWALKSNISGESNTATGESSLFNNISGSFNTAVGASSLSANATGNYNTALGYGAIYSNYSGSNNIGIGYYALVPSSSGSNQVRIGNSSITSAGIQVAWTIGSDRRWKTDIKPSDLGLNFISKLKPVSYLRKNDETKKAEYGFIAQEVDETLKSVGATQNGMITVDDAGMYNLRYNDIIAPLVKATQELNNKVESLEKTNAELLERILKLEERMVVNVIKK